MNLIVGLGNPGAKYDLTRHNIGFRLIEKIASYYDFEAPITKLNSVLYIGKIDNKKIILAKPTTFMNNSGIAVSKIANYYKIPISEIIVIHDELDLPVGKVKVKCGGGNNGHNGLRSITNSLGNDYKRVRIGIDHPGDNVAEYVLSRFSNEDKILLDQKLENIVKFLPLLINNDENFLNKINI